jgi:hypothetical protein
MHPHSTPLDGCQVSCCLPQQYHVQKKSSAREEAPDPATSADFPAAHYQGTTRARSNCGLLRPWIGPRALQHDGESAGTARSRRFRTISGERSGFICRADRQRIRLFARQFAHFSFSSLFFSVNVCPALLQSHRNPIQPPRRFLRGKARRASRGVLPWPLPTTAPKL